MAKKKNSRNEELAGEAEAAGYPVRAKSYRTGSYVPYSNEAENEEESRLYSQMNRGPASMNPNQMIEELLRIQPTLPSRRPLTPEVMPRGMPPGPYGGPAGQLPNNSFIEGYGRTLPPGAGSAGGMGMGLPAMVGAGMLIPSMIGDTTGQEDAMARLDRLSTQQGKVLPTPKYSQQETSAMLDDVMKAPSKRPKPELYSAMDDDQPDENGLERTSAKGSDVPMMARKGKKSAMQPAPMDDGMIDELVGKQGAAPAPKPGKVMQPEDDSFISEIVGGGLPRQRFRVKGAANQDEADEAASAVDYVDRGKGKIDYYNTGNKRRKFRPYK